MNVCEPTSKRSSASSVSSYVCNSKNESRIEIPRATSVCCLDTYALASASMQKRSHIGGRLRTAFKVSTAF